MRIQNIVKKVSAITLLFLSALTVFSQTTYPQGIYLSSRDLQSKTPTHTFHATVIQRKSAPLYLLGGNDYQVKSQSIQRREIRKDWLAYSDGTDLFINCYPIGLQSHYSKVLIEGEYLFFNAGIRESTVTAIVLPTALLFGLAGGVISSWIIAGKRRPYALPLSTGTPIQLRKKSMGEILSVEPELQAAYMKEDFKTDQVILRKYIKLVNSHIGVAKREKKVKLDIAESEFTKTVDLVLYRNKSKQKEELLNLLISDSISKEMVINSYTHLKLMYSSKPIKVCAGDESSCIYLDYSEKSTLYVNCSKTEKNPLAQLEIVDPSTGEWDSELARNGQRRRKRKAEKVKQ